MIITFFPTSVLGRVTHQAKMINIKKNLTYTMKKTIEQLAHAHNIKNDKHQEK